MIVLVPLLLLGLLALIVGVVRTQMSMLLRPPRMTDGKAMYLLRRMSPGDLGLPFERIEFKVPDAARPRESLRIVGWWIPAAQNSARTCVIVHGFGDAKVGALAWAPLWHELGWNTLVIDLRAHGESGGEETTGAFFERDDLDAVLNDLRVRLPHKMEHLALFGVSLGGAVVLATAAQRDDVDAVIADSVFADYADAAIVHGRLIGAPLPMLTPLAIRLAERAAGASFGQVRPLDTIKRCSCPAMLVHGGADAFVPADHVAALGDALKSRNRSDDTHLHVSSAGHCLAIVADAPGYVASLHHFLDGACGSAASASGEVSSCA